MNERIEPVISKMDETLDKYNSLYDNIIKRFDDIQSYQAKIDSTLETAKNEAKGSVVGLLEQASQQLETTRNEINSLKSHIESSLEDLKCEVRSALESVKNQAENSISSHISLSNDNLETLKQDLLQSKTVTENILSGLNKKYQKEVNNLINRINEKSNEILTIYEELENIRQSKQDIKAGLEALEKDLEEDIQKVMGNFETDSKQQIERLKAIDVSKVQNFQDEQKEIVSVLKSISSKLDENVKLSKSNHAYIVAHSNKISEIEEQLKNTFFGSLMNFVKGKSK